MMRKFINIIETAQPSTETENWGVENLQVTFRRTVDPHAYKSGGRVMVTRIRASLFLGKLLVGGYELDEGSSKVTVYIQRDRRTVSSEEEAKLLLLRQFKDA